ncbi:RraA family protein [Deinococcus sp. QL22]|uniref:RraA family protein n=1 Tax=Deinococcus sp. QL22 TaxID=2939437 RepID=UPI002017262A|nr:RraA family protein [Deinococcus sp. QL22]UQN08869.1 RraA family protein [Deinococcus sp. QL22]
MAELGQPALLAEWTALLAQEDDLTCTVSDVLGRGAALGADFRPVWPSAKFVGPAVTVRTLGSDLSAVFAGIEAAAPGSVLVSDSHGVRHSAFWGERTTRAALARGLRGAVIDGACRDVRAITALGFPVFSTGVTPNAGLRLGQGTIQEPVALGGVPVLPGDLIVADDNGVVVVPQGRTEETLRQVRAALQAEAALRLPSPSAPFKEKSHDRI